MNGTKEFVEVFASNAPSDGKFSREKGSIILNFQVAEEDTFMLGGSVRLCGKFRVLRKDNAVPSVGVSVNNYDAALPAERTYLDSRVAAYSFLDMITISSKGTAQQIEQIRNYSRLMATLLPALHSQYDIDGDQSNQTFSSTDFQYTETQISRPVAGAPGVQEISFCLRLYTGLLYSKNPIPLSDTFGLKGLNIQLQITHPAMALYSLKENNAAADDTGATANGGSYYELSDCSLQFEQIRPHPDALPKLRSKTTGTFSYNSWVSLYNVINSSNHSAVFDLGLKNVVACFMNFLPVNYNNNYNHNSFEVGRLRNCSAASVYDGPQVAIKQLMFTRGGIKFPNEYVIIKNTNEAGIVHSQTQREFLNAIRPFVDIDHTVDRVEVANQQRTSARVLSENWETTKAGGAYFGLGISYDAFSERGADFSGTQWGYTLQTDLGTNGFEAPHSAYIYFLSRNTLAWSPTGLNVVD